MSKWIDENGNYDHMGRAFRKTKAAEEMLKYNRILNMACADSVEMVERKFH